MISRQAMTACVLGVAVVASMVGHVHGGKYPQRYGTRGRPVPARPVLPVVRAGLRPASNENPAIASASHAQPVLPVVRAGLRPAQVAALSNGGGTEPTAAAPAGYTPFPAPAPAHLAGGYDGLSPHLPPCPGGCPGCEPYAACPLPHFFTTPNYGHHATHWRVLPFDYPVPPPCHGYGAGDAAWPVCRQDQSQEPMQSLRDLLAQAKARTRNPETATTTAPRLDVAQTADSQAPPRKPQGAGEAARPVLPPTERSPMRVEHAVVDSLPDGQASSVEHAGWKPRR